MPLFNPLITNVGGTQGIGGGNNAGTATTVAASDHDHAIRETGGPTDLTVGAIADGQTLVRSGSTIIGSAGGSGLTQPQVLARASVRV